MAESKVTAETYEDTCGTEVWDKFLQLRKLCHGDTDRELHLLAKLWIAKQAQEDAKQAQEDGKVFNETYQNVFAMTHGKFILYWRLHSKEWPKDSDGKSKEVTDVNQFGDNQSDDDDDY